MPDIPLRDVPAGVVAAIDPNAQRQGLARSEYLRPTLLQDATRTAGTVAAGRAFHVGGGGQAVQVQALLADQGQHRASENFADHWSRGRNPATAVRPLMACSAVRDRCSGRSNRDQRGSFSPNNDHLS
ncbi:MAG: hypothetical protein ACRDTC_28215 [Pseudonocardiaceae bacterium]